MKLRLFFLFVFSLLAAQDEPPITITSPQAGEVLRGTVTITGTTDIPNFFSAQLDFSYTSNPTGTWFAIQTLSQPVTESTITTWDTTSITDGDYILRLRVNLIDNTFQEITVPIQIGNDVTPPTPAVVPTATLNAVVVQIATPFLLAASPTPTTPPRPTPTALPTNPASLGQTAIYASLGRGALVILGLFALSGLFIRLRRF
ncbi:MAG TPA: hypothetical protein VJM08_01430 [Anaerolineales bacterium]|nr:hypothetical protein [Anaerolineales bacterium]